MDSSTVCAITLKVSVVLPNDSSKGRFYNHILLVIDAVLTYIDKCWTFTAQ